jgi:predicted phosphodiesterase
MIYGVFSDIHGNYEALKAVLIFFRKNKAENFICCGDLVGYGPQPVDCVREVMEMRHMSIVLGNHDAALVGKLEMRWFNQNAIAALDYARKSLSGSELAYLAALPEKVKTADFTLVHGSPRKPLTEYMLSEAQFIDNLNYWDTSPCFVGHSHLPVYFRQSPGSPPETDFMVPASKLMLAGVRYVLNPGSTGQPRDGNPRASCGLYESKKKTFEICRLEYDYARTQDLMRTGGLPHMLVERLALGL